MATVALYIVTAVYYESKVAGSFAIPRVAFPLGVSAALSKTVDSLSPLLRNFRIRAHVILILLRNAAFPLACCGALMYVVQEWRLKSKRPTVRFERLPA